ncbi:MAG: flap endonuclease [Chloroflexi bacterium]|nr:MAG: flap endonuclease [Chloroflexota bacterium]
MASRPDWLLIDGSSLIFRAYFGVPNSVRAPDGRLVNGVRGFLDTLARLIFTRRPARLAVASDEDWRPKHRVALIPSYKAHRVAEPIPPELDPQMPLIAAVLEALGLDFVGAPTLEAEDVIASWVEQLEGARIEIVSGDRDLFALVRDPLVRVLYPERGGLAEVDESAVTRRYGIPGRLYADFAVLRGDPSDGLPGLPGVGAKTAASLVTKYQGVAGLLEAGRLSAADADYVRKALEVVKPGSSKPVPVPPGRRDSYPADPARLVALSEELGLDSSLEKLLQALQSVAAPRPPSGQGSASSAPGQGGEV